MVHQVVLKQFTPAQAAEITGVSAGLQRQWRSMGYFKAAAGEGAHARFTLPELAGLSAARALVDGGLSYKQAAPHLPSISHAIHQWISGCRDFFEGPDDFEIKHGALEAYRTSIGEVEDCGPFYVVLPSGLGEFVYDGEGLTRFFETHRAAGAAFVSVEGAAHCIGKFAGPLGAIREVTPCERGTEALDRKAWLKAYRAARRREKTGRPSPLQKARALADERGISLYSAEGLALARQLLRETS